MNALKRALTVAFFGLLAMVHVTARAAPVPVDHGAPVTFNFDLTGLAVVPPFNVVFLSFVVSDLVGAPASVSLYRELDGSGSSSGNAYVYANGSAGGFGFSGSGLGDGIFSAVFSASQGVSYSVDSVYAWALVGDDESGYVSTERIAGTLAGSDVPEPASLALVGLAFVAAAAVRRRKGIAQGSKAV